MFGKQINKSNSSFINQITMVQSKCQKFDNTFKKKINLPATLFNKSPLKERQNKQIIGNTPIRKASTNVLKILQPSDQSKRISISPLRNRRQGSNLSEVSKKQKLNQSNRNINVNVSITNSQINKSKKPQNTNDSRKTACQNHKNKQSKFIICIQDQLIPYCEKCAISLVSQGFVVKKIDEQMQQDPRTEQINQFLQDLESVMKILGERKQQVEKQIQKSNECFNQQKSYINMYYEYIIEAITNHKESVLKNYNQYQQSSQSLAVQSLKVITEAINDSIQMKQDIYSSLELIKQAEQKAFRPVMESYKQNSRKFKQNTCKIEVNRIKEAKKLVFNNVENITNQLLKKIEIKMEGNNNQFQSKQKFSGSIPVQNEALSLQKSKVNFSFDNNPYEDYEENHFDNQNNENLLDYDQKQENPLEHISEQEYGKQKSIKSSTKDVKSSYFADFNQ